MCSCFSATRSLEAVSAFCEDVRPHEVFREGFTPKTLHHYTAKENGAIGDRVTVLRKDAEVLLTGRVLRHDLIDVDLDMQPSPSRPALPTDTRTQAEPIPPPPAR